MLISIEDLKDMQIALPDEMLNFLINLTDRKIKNFCNIEEVPKELKEMQIQMCKDLYDLRYNKQKINEEGTTTVKEETELKSIKRGDAQFEFTSNAEKVLNEKKLLTELINNDNFLFNYENELYDFRKFRW